MERILAMIEVEKPSSLREYPISFSYGIAMNKENPKHNNPMDLITSADQEMYRYKKRYKAQQNQA
jgi:GGDEF domain-containing protein